MRQYALASAILLWGAGVRLSFAAEPAAVEALIRQGVKLRRSGENHAALPFFQQAYELGHTPRTAAQLGLVEMSLGYPLDAERHLTESLTAKHDVWVDQKRAVLEKSLEEVRNSIGSIALIDGPAGAAVSLNGVDVGSLPLKKDLRAGEGPAEIVIKADGYRPFKETVAVSGARRTEVTVNLERERSMAPAPHLLTPPPPARTEPVEEVSTPAPPPRSSSGTRTAAWILTASSVAAASFAGYETASWIKRRDEFDNHVGPSRTQPTIRNKNCGADDPGRGGMGCSDLYQPMNSSRTLMLVGYAVTGALLAGGLTLFLISGSGASPEPPAVACAPAGAGPGAVCRFTF